MNDLELQAWLASGNARRIRVALGKIGAERSVPPSDVTLQMASKHLRDPDPLTRGEAVFAVGIHWGFEPCFPELLRLVDEETDPDVMHSVLLALGRMGDRALLKRPVLQVLATVALASRRAADERSVAYIQARWVAGELSPPELAGALLDPQQVAIDEGWLTGVLSGVE